MLSKNSKKDLVEMILNSNREFKIEEYLNALFTKLESEISA